MGCQLVQRPSVHWLTTAREQWQLRQQQQRHCRFTGHHHLQHHRHHCTILSKRAQTSLASLLAGCRLHSLQFLPPLTSQVCHLVVGGLTAQMPAGEEEGDPLNEHSSKERETRTHTSR